MSLRKYLKVNKIDQIEDGQEFEEAEYTAIQTYCENCGYIIGSDDIAILKKEDWKIVMIFGEIIMFMIYGKSLEKFQ